MDDRMTLEKCGEIADCVSASYARSYATVRDDLRQEAWMAILKSKTTWRPEVGMPVEAYCYRAAVLKCWSWIRRSRCPVSGSNRGLREMATMVGTDPLHDTDSDRTAPCRDGLDLHAMEDRMMARQLLGRVLMLLRAGGEAGEIASEVILDGKAPGDVAISRGLPPDRVYPLVRRWRKRLASDPVVAELRAS